SPPHLSPTTPPPPPSTLFPYTTLFRSEPDNLALACDRCNFYKGPNLSAIDPVSGQVVTIFNPRQQEWTEHFRDDEFCIIALTPVDRKSTRLNSSHVSISYAVFCLKKKK